MQKKLQVERAVDYVAPQISLVEITVEQGISISDTDFEIPGFGDEGEW